MNWFYEKNGIMKFFYQFKKINYFGYKFSILIKKMKIIFSKDVPRSVVEIQHLI